MSADDPNRLFSAAETAYGAGRWGDARRRLDRLAGLIPPHPAVLHLSGLVHRRLGSLDCAVADLEHAARLAPTDPDIRNNLGNALTDAGRDGDAVEAYTAAVRLRPSFTDGWRNLSLALASLERWPEAVAAARTAVRAGPEQAVNWSVLGAALRSVESLDEAAHAFDEALRLAPQLASALAGRARIALERGEADALARHELALARMPDDRDLLLGAVQADLGSTALDRLRARLRLEPDWLEGHRTYVKLASRRGEPADTTLCDGRQRRPDDAALAIEHATVLVQAEREGDALALIDGLAAGMRDLVPIQQSEAFAAMMTDDLDRAHRVLAQLARTAADIAAEPLAYLALRERDPAAAAAALEPLVEADTATVSHWALLSLAWRMLGDEREDWLHGQAGLVATQDLKLTDEELSKSIALLRQLHAASRAQPLGQSMRGGTQTRGRLFARTEPVLRMLADRLRDAVERYRAALPKADPRHPLLRHREADWAISGSWSVRLTGTGYHIHHIHPHGVVSSAAYLRVPELGADEQPQAGWLTLGASPRQLRLDLPPTGVIEPQVGRLALFPSTLYHGTVPFRSGERLTVAFDVTPRA